MIVRNDKIRILFFIGSLRAGGKERRLIELLSFLKKEGLFEVMIVFTSNEIHYTNFFDLELPYHVINKKWSKNDLTIFYKFYKIAKKFKPDLIHTWGRKQSFYSLPSVLFQKIPLVNSQITSAPPKVKKLSINYIIDKVNFKFSKIILSNSRAGIQAYNPPINKAKIVYNGINLNRFSNLPPKYELKIKYKIDTAYCIIMVASASPNKNYSLFYKIAQRIIKIRNDISFIGVGWYIEGTPEYNDILSLTTDYPKLIFQGNINDVEALINSCDIGVLFSNKLVHGEGISNAILEYMALSKPVIANDAGGTREIIVHNENGYLIEDHSEEEIAKLILNLIDDKSKSHSFGKRSREIIENSFSLDRMGREFVQAYIEVLSDEPTKTKKTILANFNTFIC